MSLEHDWPLTVWPTRGEVERAITDLLAAAKIDNPAISHEPWDDDEDFDDEDEANGLPAGDRDAPLPGRMTITLVFRVRAAAAIDVALRLDKSATRESYAKFLSPPLEGGDTYELAVDLVAPDDDEEEQARVEISTGSYDNREAYGIVAVLAADLAGRLETLSAFS
jgi:hypothetical protein